MMIMSKSKLLSSLQLLFRLLFAVTYVYVFVVSGLIVSLLCLLLTVILWPCSKTTYRRLASWLGYSVIGQMVWVCNDWATVDVVLFGEESTYANPNKDAGLVTCSHRGDLDWVAGFIVAAQFKFLHAARSLPKRSVLFVPGFGQIMWSLENPFLKRNYASDQKTIAEFSAAYSEYPYPVKVVIFCEGTRFTVEKHKLAVKYAREKGLPELKHHLVPRTKGFAILAENLKAKGKFKYIYDVGFAYRNWPGEHLPSFLDVLLGKKIEILWYMRKFPMEDLPTGQEELQRFCYKLFEEKDKAYEYFLQNGTFPAPEQPSPPSFSNTLWLLRLNQLFWFTLTCVIPSLSLFSMLSWTTLGMVGLGGLLLSVVLLLGILKYAYGGDIPTDVPDPMSKKRGATPEKRTLTSSKKLD